MTVRVGPVLEANDAGRAVAAAILERCRDAEIVDRGAYLRVLVPDRCVVDRATVERILGRAFRLPSDLESVMPSFQGTLSITSDAVVWSFEGRHG